MTHFDPLAMSLCGGCAHVREIRSARDSVFLMCERAKTDARFQKYAPQPVISCEGFEPAGSEGEGEGAGPGAGQA